VRDRLAVLRPWPEIVLFGALMVALVVYYKFTKPPYHAHYLSEFMSQDDVGVGMLLLNGLNRNLSAFSALSLPDNAVLAPVVLGLLTVIMLGPGVLIPRYAPQSFARRSVVLVLLVVATEIFFLACIERYPWGGRLRHQYVLFPFLFLWVVLAADALTRRLSLRSSYLVAAVLLAGCIATSIHSHRSDIVIDEYVSRPLWLDEVQELEALIDTPTAIYLSRFDKIGIYRSVREEGGWRGTKQVTLRDGSTSDCLDGKLAGKPMRFYADRDQWQVPARPDQEFAKRLADLAQQEQLPRLLVFTVRQRQPGLATDRREHEVAWRETYQAAGLVLRRLVVIGTGEIHELLRQ